MDSPLLARAPGRVNLIGEHVDYAGGPVLPLALSLGTSVHGHRGGQRVRLTSAALPGALDMPLDPALDPATASAPIRGPAPTTGGGDAAARDAGPHDAAPGHAAARDAAARRPTAGTAPPTGDAPGWVALAAAVVSAVAPRVGLTAHVSGDLPLGAGLSSSASFAVALALALGWRGTGLELARLVQDAEARARGVPCGLMDPLVIAVARPDAALLIDCASGVTRPVPWPASLALAVVDSGVRRELAGSAYAARRAEVEAAAARLGPLPAADLAAAASLPDGLARRARHVISECARVRAAVTALEAGDGATLGALLDASHASLSGDFEVSTPGLDGLVASLRRRPGVLGARLTGAGFGGHVVVLLDADATCGAWPEPTLRVRPAAGALAGLDGDD